MPADFVAPVEVVETCLQQQQQGQDKAMRQDNVWQCLVCDQNIRLSSEVGAQGPVHAAVTIVKQDGPLGLWAGAAPTVMRNGTNQMCLFWAKNNFDRMFFGKIEGDGRQLHPWQSMLSGFSAACIGPCATGPFDVIKVRIAQGL